MRLDRHFREIEGLPAALDRASESPSLGAFCPVGFGPASQWAEVYRLAYLQAVEALRPTRYDHMRAASAN